MSASRTTRNARPSSDTVSAAPKRARAVKPVVGSAGLASPGRRPAAAKPSPAGSMLKEIRVRGEKLTADINHLLLRLG